MGGNIPGGNFLGGNFPRWSLVGGNFPGGSFPDTLESLEDATELSAQRSKSRNCRSILN